MALITQPIYTKPELAKHYADNLTVAIGDVTSAANTANVFFGAAGDSVNVTLNLVDSEGNIQTQIDQTELGYPPVLALPIVKLKASNEVESELYMKTTITNGIVVATLPSVEEARAGGYVTSGAWVLSQARINKAIAEIGANWQIVTNDVHLRIIS